MQVSPWYSDLQPLRHILSTAIAGLHKSSSVCFGGTSILISTVAGLAHMPIGSI